MGDYQFILINIISSLTSNSFRTIQNYFTWHRWEDSTLCLSWDTHFAAADKSWENITAIHTRLLMSHKPLITLWHWLKPWRQPTDIFVLYSNQQTKHGRHSSLHSVLSVGKKNTDNYVIEKATVNTLVLTLALTSPQQHHNAINNMQDNTVSL